MKAEMQPRSARPSPWRDKCNRGREFRVASTLVLGARGCKPRMGAEIQALYACCTQYQEHYANDADEWERYGFFKKSKTRVTKHDDHSKEHHHDGANLDQSCRSTKIISYLKEDQFEFLEERRQKDLVNEFTDF